MVPVFGARHGTIFGVNFWGQYIILIRAWIFGSICWNQNGTKSGPRNVPKIVEFSNALARNLGPDLVLAKLQIAHPKVGQIRHPSKWPLFAFGWWSSFGNAVRSIFRTNSLGTSVQIIQVFNTYTWPCVSVYKHLDTSCLWYDFFPHTWLWERLLLFFSGQTLPGLQRAWQASSPCSSTWTKHQLHTIMAAGRALSCRNVRYHSARRMGKHQSAPLTRRQGFHFLASWRTTLQSNPSYHRSW